MDDPKLSAELPLSSTTLLDDDDEDERTELDEESLLKLEPSACWLLSLDASVDDAELSAWLALP
jgi:hypothetical protein